MKKQFVGIILIVIGLVLLFGLGIPKWQEIGMLRDEVAELREVKDAVDDAIAIHQQLLSDYQAIPQERIARLQSMIPPSADREQIILILQNVSRRNGMQLENVRFREQEQREEGILRQQLSVVGSYDGFQGFLRDLEDSLRLTEVSNVRFSASDDGSYTFSVDLISYFIASEIIATN